MTATVNDSKDSVTFSGAKSETIGPFTLLGGKYFAFGSAADTTSELDMLMPDGSTYQSIGSSTKVTTSAYTSVVDLPRAPTNSSSCRLPTPSAAASSKSPIRATSARTGGLLRHRR